MDTPQIIPPEGPPPMPNDRARDPQFIELRLSEVADKVMALEADIAVVRQEAVNRPSRINLAVGALICLLLPLLGALAWWAWLDPIAPTIVVEHSEIHERRPTAPTDGRRIFEVVRIISSDADAPCTIQAYFRRAGSEAHLEYEGRPVIRDLTTFQIASAESYVERGRHRRDRLWETPGALPQGEWSYFSVMKFCNPLRCKDVNLPSLTVTLR